MYDDYEGESSLPLFLQGVIALCVIAALIYAGGLFISKFRERKFHFTLMDILKLIWLIVSVIIVLYILCLFFPGFSFEKANDKFSEHVALTGFSGVLVDIFASVLLTIICIGGITTYFNNPKNNTSMKEQNFQIFLKCLLNSTKLISPQYFQLPVAYQVDDIERERNYCYELYRFIRNNLPEDYPYTFSGEIDKSGHHYIAPQCGAVTPDFLVHRPGHMGPDDNLIIIEVKTFSGATTTDEDTGFIKDIRTVNCMLGIQNGYYKGILIIVGTGSDRRTQQIKKAYLEKCNQERILLIWHKEALTSATIHA